MKPYNIPDSVKIISSGARPLLTTPQGGKIALDNTLISLWKAAGQHTLDEVIQNFQAENATPNTIRGGLACLAEAGLLERGDAQPQPPQYAPVHGPKVAAVIVSYNSRQWLETCIPSLLAQTYSPIDIIIVDNGSQDDTVAWLEANYPQFPCLENGLGRSLAHAMNRGAGLADGTKYLLMLNPDLDLQPDAIAQMVAVAEANPQCGAVAAKLRFWWARSFLNGVGNRVGAFSWGTDNALGHLDLGQFDHWGELPSACFAAALISMQAWQAVGPVDEGFPMYYEDTEWCYRARLRGYKILLAPKAVIFHAFGGRVPSGEAQPLSPGKLKNVVFGRLRFAIKITGEYLPLYLRNYLLEDLANFGRTLLSGKWASSLAYLRGWANLVGNLRTLLPLRRSLQLQRVISDYEMAKTQAEMPMTFAWNGIPEMTWELVINHYTNLILSGRTKPMPEFDPAKRKPHLLIVSNDIVDEKMAGPGMRYLEIARALNGEDIEVTLAIPRETKLQEPGIKFVRYWEERPASLRVLVENCDVALVSGYMVEKFPFLGSTTTRLVVDLYDPTILENLHYYLDEPADSQIALNLHGVAVTNLILRLGDYFICGNERQRDFWLGLLAANERVNPQNFSVDPSFRSLIDVVGIGFPDREPQTTSKLLRGVHKNIPEDAQIVLWGGGIWNWLDPLSLIQAWPKVIAKYPKARLVFLGTRHPNPLVPVHEMARKAQAMVEDLGELDKSILFIEWVSYQDREALLNEADIGVSLHPIHVETRYSIRTRVLDYIWARLPVMLTSGDITSEWVAEYHLGEVVPPFDPEAITAALDRLLAHQKSDWQQAFDPLIEQFHWSKVVEPLRKYCLHGGYAADRLDRRSTLDIPAPATRNLWARMLFILRTEGLKAVFHRAWRYLQWRLSRT